MKATGIVRRIDDLGRVVIPKEIRRTMRIREGDPLEIFTSSAGEVVFKKYSPVGEIGEFAAQYAESLYKTCGMSVIIGDRESVIACAGLPKKDFLKKSFSKEFEDIIENRALYVADGRSDISATDSEEDGYSVTCAMPIISEGDIAGCVAAVISKDMESQNGDTEMNGKLVQTAASFLGRMLEQ